MVIHRYIIIDRYVVHSLPMLSNFNIVLTVASAPMRSVASTSHYLVGCWTVPSAHSYEVCGKYFPLSCGMLDSSHCPRLFTWSKALGMNICCCLNLSLREIAPSHNSKTCFAGKGLNLSGIICVTVIMLPIKSCTGTAGLCGMKPVRCRPVLVQQVCVG